MKKLREVWIIPQFHDAGDNQWVMLGTAMIGGKVIRSLRLFSFEPGHALVEHQRRVLQGKLETDAVDMEVFMVAPDYFEDGEKEIAGQ